MFRDLLIFFRVLHLERNRFAGGIDLRFGRAVGVAQNVLNRLAVDDCLPGYEFIHVGIAGRGIELPPGVPDGWLER